VELKQRNPRCGCPRIAQQLAKTFGIEIDKDVVRRILAAHYRPDHGVGGPTWLTLLGQPSEHGLVSAGICRKGLHCKRIHRTPYRQISLPGLSSLQSAKHLTEKLS
jgi:hypothetical protein